MEYSRKVALVPQQLLSSLLAQQQLNPAFNHLANLDQNMQNMLNTSNLPPDLKHKQYNQMMHRYQTMRDQEMNKSFPINVTKMEAGVSSTIPADDIIEALPKSFKNKGRMLLSHIKRTKNITADDQGQVVVNGKTIEGSNITDLVFDYVRPRKGWGPTGWKEFGKALKQTNVPREAIVNTTRWHQVDLPTFGLVPEDLQPQQPIQPEDDSSSDATVQFKTPPATKRLRQGTPVSGSSSTGKGPRKGTRIRKPTKPYTPYEKPATWRKYKQK